MDTTHLCKLCLRSFPNGWALGGHMRSHSLSLHIPPLRQLLWSQSHDSAEGGTALRFQNYGLRENPRRSIRSADPEDYEDGSASVLVQDHESETESSRNLTRRRSKRARRSFPPRELKSRLPVSEKLSWVKVGDSSEPASSISEETSEEDVAFCLMLLSRDRWKNNTEMVGECRDEKGFGVDDEEEEDDGTEEDEYFDEASESDDGAEVKSGSRKRTNTDRGKYRCETCNKFFRSYQAFGGHRASHKKARLSMSTAGAEQEESTNKHNNKIDNNNADSGGSSNKVHKCPFCNRVFASGQALGGHKRSHTSKSNYYAETSRTTTTSARDSPIPGRGTIDLNMPAPAEDESSRVEFGG